MQTRPGANGSGLSPGAPLTLGTKLETTRRWVTLASVIAAVLIAMAEIDRLISAVVSLDDNGRESGASHSLSSVTGLLPFSATDAWSGWQSSAFAEQVALWIVFSVALDAVFIVCYARAAGRFISSFGSRSTVTMRWTLRLLISADVAEGVGLLFGAVCVAVGFPITVVAGVLPAVSMAKWALTAVLLVLFLRTPTTRGALRAAARRGWQALWTHRLSAVTVLLLGALACIPKDGVLDQLPDVQRQWIGGEHLGQAAWAAVAVVLAALSAFALGRARTRLAVARYARTPAQCQVERTAREVAWWWAIPLIAWLVVAAIAFALSRDLPSVLGAGAIAFVAIPVTVWSVSWLLERGRRMPKDPPPPSDVDRARYAWLTGDVLAFAIITTAGLGLVRSATVPAALALADLDVAQAGWSVVTLTLSAALAIASPRLLRALNPVTRPPARILAPLLDSNDPNQPRVPPRAIGAPHDARSSAEQRRWRAHQGWLAAIIAIALLILLLLALFPAAAGTLGIVATTVLVITCWTAALGAFTVALQEYQPLALFRRLRLRATPVLTLALVLPLLYGSIFGVLAIDGNPHLIRVLPTTDADAENPDALADRLSENTCTITVGDGIRIRPVLLVAAEGGGIRAAYWTGHAMERILGTGCFDSTVLISSGVSGGSVGLTLTGLDGGAASMTDRLHSLASPDTLAMAVSGLLVGDVSASALGVKLPSVIAQPADFPESDAASNPFGVQWRDRAALIETGWIQDVTELSAPYSTRANPRTGITVLNSTDADSGCRVGVGSESALGITHTASTNTETASAAERCEQAWAAPAMTWWAGEECLAHLDRATAAMLSARFPIVTPAGRLPGNGCDPHAQLIDGGYAEGTGIGTIADVSTRIAAAVRAENSTSAVPLVPIVVYLRNSSGFDLFESLNGITAEPLVPLVGYGTKAQQLTDTAWLQRASLALADVCDGAYESRCETAITGVEKILPSRLVVVSPQTRPAVVPPLGWALSEYSRTSLDDALTAEAKCGREPLSDDSPARLCNLLKLGK